MRLALEISRKAQNLLLRHHDPQDMVANYNYACYPGLVKT